MAVSGLKTEWERAGNRLQDSKRMFDVMADYAPKGTALSPAIRSCGTCSIATMNTRYDLQSDTQLEGLLEVSERTEELES